MRVRSARFASAMILLWASTAACGTGGPDDGPPPGSNGAEPAGRAGSGDGSGADPAESLYADVSDEALPLSDLEGLSMDAALADLDADGDLDVVVANEHRPNILLLNQGQGRFHLASDRLPASPRDSEDIGIADFDGDGDPDIVVVSEDDRVNELYLNDGDARFSDGGDRLPVEGTSNAVAVADLNGDGAPDLLIGNAGQNYALVNDGAGRFRDETADRLPRIEDTTQDLELGDVDGDGDADLLVGNEDRNRLLLNDGHGRFTDASAERVPLRGTPEETREADFGDVDGDGDLDILFANVRAFVEGADPRNRLLVNDGTGHFADETEARLPPDTLRSFDGDFFDLDGDGDLDVITANSTVDLAAGRIDPAPYLVYLNDGDGRFREATAEVLPAGTTGVGFDAEFGQLGGDDQRDLYLASRGTADRLLFRMPE